MPDMKFTMTSNIISVVWDGKAYTVHKDSPNFERLRAAVLTHNYDEIPNLLTVAKTIASWAHDKFTVEGETIKYNGEDLPPSLNDRILKMVSENSDPTILFNFWERLRKNPSHRSIVTLFDFLAHEGIPITPEGCFLAYKGVNRNYTDKHTGTIENVVGSVHEMERCKISDDPRTPCHYGFHVGALEYAQNFAGGDSGRVIICKVDPADVVCVPYDHSCQKMRVCKYEVVGNLGAQLPSTVFSVDENVYDAAYENDGEGEEMAEPGDDMVNVVDALPIPDMMLIHLEPELPTEGAKIAAPAGFEAMHALGAQDLLHQPLSALRRYAVTGLKIVGAELIEDGVELVKRIVQVRGK